MPLSSHPLSKEQMLLRITEEEEEAQRSVNLPKVTQQVGHPVLNPVPGSRVSKTHSAPHLIDGL